MPDVLEALLDSWDRNNAITTNLLRLVPADAFDLTPMDGSPSIGALFTHIHYVRHESYHHGQIKLALTLAGRPISDDEAGPGTWAIWMEKGVMTKKR